MSAVASLQFSIHTSILSSVINVFLLANGSGMKSSTIVIIFMMYTVRTLKHSNGLLTPLNIFEIELLIAKYEMHLSSLWYSSSDNVFDLIVQYNLLLMGMHG